ncbi:ATP pyrophosphatase [Lentibacillus populi]|uniref:ATP pyrophosphatase n=1 Tax=Lentibacillus populi TaxID=1827502 RepID=A0A9W5U1R1_9BACI|nr:diphthine--ammonia ligase [Lentibacillus populi]GGB61587.1 ATP pyrophosphatase [Lentibacillus populi]
MKVALSFSGGKDSCLALYRLEQQGYHVVSLITTIWKEKQETVAHGEKLERIKKQAERIGIPVHFIETDFAGYTEDFVRTLKDLKTKYEIDSVAFGDIYLEGHREWGEQVAEKADVAPIYPLWTEKHKVLDLLREFVALKFQARVIKVDNTKLPENWVGRLVDESFIADISGKDVCPLGESGEYHTTVFDGPIFRKQV